MHGKTSPDERLQNTNDGAHAQLWYMEVEAADSGNRGNRQYSHPVNMDAVLMHTVRYVWCTLRSKSKAWKCAKESSSQMLETKRKNSK